MYLPLLVWLTASLPLYFSEIIITNLVTTTLIITFYYSQALSIILAMVLRALGPENEIEYDSDDDAVPARLPLLRNKPQHGPSYGEPNSPRRIDSWHVRILDKVRCLPINKHLFPLYVGENCLSICKP